MISGKFNLKAMAKKDQLQKPEVTNGGSMHEEPGDLVLRMTKDPEERKCSHVRWSVQREVFVTGSYPYLSWNLYDSRPDENKSDSPTPEVFFRTIKDLGHGSFGIVRLVELRLSGERLAMKVMDKEKCPRTLRMKELHAFLQTGVSPFIVRFHSCFQTDSACYLLMQYHCGGSLAKIIEEFGVLSEETARFFTAEVTEGLLHLHNRGIIHRDIKLANILLGVDNHVRICDLGLCKLGMTANSKTHTRCGALRYCAPEVLAREWYSKEVDWWSLGVVLFRLLTGQYPFDARSREIIEEMIKRDEPNLDIVPSGTAKDLISQFLHKRASERLGAGDKAEKLIRSHPFFGEIHWDQLQARRLKAPSVQKRFMRHGSVIRRLAFGLGNPDAFMSSQIMGRVFQILLRLLILTIIVGTVLTITSPKRRDAIKAYMTHLKARVGSMKVGNG